MHKVSATSAVNTNTKHEGILHDTAMHVCSGVSNKHPQILTNF